MMCPRHASFVVLWALSSAGCSPSSGPAVSSDSVESNREIDVNSAEGREQYIDEVARAVRSDVPVAAQMTLHDMGQIMELRRSTPTPMTSMIEDVCDNKSLTLILYTLRPEEDPQAKQQFELLTDYFSAARGMGEELQRTSQINASWNTPGVMTLVAADRIKLVTCEVDGGIATGIVAFETPGIYRGRVEYVAKNQDDSWRVTEFNLSAYGIRLYRNADDSWRKEVE